MVWNRSESVRVFLVDWQRHIFYHKSYRTISYPPFRDELYYELDNQKMKKTISRMARMYTCGLVYSAVTTAYDCNRKTNMLCSTQVV